MANDIKQLLYGIKENIKLIEDGDYDDNRLDEVRSDFLEMMELIKLFMISERDSYYGYFMMNMQFCVDFQSNGIAGIKLNTFPPVFVSNPLLLCKFSLKEIIYVTCHEIDHVVLNHPAEMVKSNPENDQERFYEFNLAADAAVNDRIDNEITTEKHKFMSRPDGCITSSYIGSQYNVKHIRFMENYAYYFEIITGGKSKSPQPENSVSSMMAKVNMKDDNNEEKGSQDNDENTNSDTDGLDNSDASESNKDDKNEDGKGSGEKKEGEKSTENDNGEKPSDGDGGDKKQSKNGQKTPVVTSKNCDNYSDHQWDAGDDPEEATAAAKEFVNTAVNSMNDESRGLMPAEFMSQVKKINEPPKLSWQKILKKYIGTISANKTKTRMRLNRRQPERFDLSGTKEDKVLKIVVAIDTSGSVSDQMISKIFNEIFDILAKRKHEITVIECDAKVERVYKVKKRSDVQLKVAGRGGTWFSPVFEYVNKDKYFRDALLIYFTDGFGERKIPKPLTYRNIWVVFGGEENLSVENPYGIVLKL